MLQDLNFKGRSALITGASQGIGLATAKVLAAYGATVFLASRSYTELEKEAESLRSEGLSAFAIECDVTDYDSVVAAVDAVIEQAETLDFLINNAGVIEPLSTLAESDPVTWGLAADINYKGVYYGMRASISVMLKQGRGTIVNISSGAANKALTGWSHYCSSKAAAKKLTEVAHKELCNENIHVIGLSPGTVATSMMEKIRDAKINAVSDLDWNVHISPMWVGEGVAFLCGSNGAKYSGTDFTLKTSEGRALVGLPTNNGVDG